MFKVLLFTFLFAYPLITTAETYEGADSLKPHKDYQNKAKAVSDIDPELLNDEIPDDPRIRFATYFGGTGADAAQDFKIDSQGYLYAIGNTFSTDFPMVGNSFDSEKTEEDYIDAFIVKFDTLGFPVWSTYFGGTGEDRGIRLEIDSEDNIIITGATNSPNFPLKGEFDQDSIKGEADMYVAKFDKDGNLLWSRLFGGSRLDQSFGLALDDEDNIYVAGNTMSYDIVRSDWTYQTEYAFYYKHFAEYSDGVFAKFSPEGKHIWSSYLGASETEHLEDIDVYGDEITVVGRVSADYYHKDINPRYIIGTEDAIQQLPCDTTYYEHFQFFDPFIAKFSTDSCKLKYFTYYCSEGELGNYSDNYYFFSEYDANGNYILLIHTDNNNMQVKGSPFHTYSPMDNGGIMMMSLSPQNNVNWDWDITDDQGFSGEGFTIDNNVFWGEVTAFKNVFPEEENHFINRDIGAQRDCLLMRFDLNNFSQWYSYHPHLITTPEIVTRNNNVYLLTLGLKSHLLKKAYSEQFTNNSMYLINLDLRNDFGYSSIDTGKNDLSNISVYPSIASEIIKIASEDSMETIQILDVLGKTLYAKELNMPTNEIELNIENYADGMYFILLNNKYSLKFIKE